jgi:DNA topoisomerase-2
MHLFDSKDTLQKYENVSDIINSYYDVRLNLYRERKEYLIDALEKELILLSNKTNYIKENLDGTIDLRKKKKDEIITMLEMKGYYKIENDQEYKYLVKMPMDSVTEENIEKLLKDKESKEEELEMIRNVTINKMWLNELQILKKHYIEYKDERTRLMNGDDTTNKKKVTSKSSSKKITKKQSLLIEEV